MLVVDQSLFLPLCIPYFSIISYLNTLTVAFSSWLWRTVLFILWPIFIAEFCDFSLVAVCSLEACCRQLDLLFVWMASIVTNIQIFFIDFSIWLATLLIECCLNCVNGLLCFFTKSVNEMQEKWIFNET